MRHEKALNVTSTVVHADLTTPVMGVWFLVTRQIDQYRSVAKEVKRLDLLRFAVQRDLVSVSYNTTVLCR